MPRYGPGTWTAGRRPPARRQLHGHDLLAAPDAPAQLDAAGTDYPAAALAGYPVDAAAPDHGLRWQRRQIAVPAVSLGHRRSQSIDRDLGSDGTDARAVLAVRPGVRARAAARRAGPRRRTRSSQSVHALPRAGYTYSENPPPAATRSRASCSTTRSATASSSPGRWRCCCGWAGFRRASPPASRPGTYDNATHRVGRQRHRRARVGRGVVPALRLGALRPDPGRGAGARRPRRRSPATTRASRRRDAGRPRARSGTGAGAGAGGPVQATAHGGGTPAWLIVDRARGVAGADRARCCSPGPLQRADARTSSWPSSSARSRAPGARSATG